MHLYNKCIRGLITRIQVIITILVTIISPLQLVFFTQNVNAAVPTASVVVPGSGTTTGGDTVTITGTNFSPTCTQGTGGSITYTDSNGANPSDTPYVNGYVVHTFTSNGTLVLASSCNAEVLVVGGGGGGSGAGGGGSGGIVYNSSYTIHGGSTSVTVGAGGAANTQLRPPTEDVGNGKNGGNSILGTITAYGGGGGGMWAINGLNGGSGGGGGHNYNNVPTYGGATIQTSNVGGTGYGNAGGGSAGFGSAGYPAGGGGGAGHVGYSATSGTAAGDGGYGIAFSISGTSKYYGGGGGGGLATGSGHNGTGGSGGGGAGATYSTASVAGTNNTGGGGGGGSDAQYGAKGGTGVVIVKYKTQQQNISVTFGSVVASDVQVVNATTLTAKVPAHTAGAVNVVVTNLDGSVTLTNGYTYKVPGYNVVTNNPDIGVYLSNDSGVDVSTTPQNAPQDISVTRSSKVIAEFTADFSNANLVWSGVTADIQSNKSFFHATQGINNISGGSSDSYSLFIPKSDGNEVYICPGATSLAAVNLNCPGGYYLSEGETKYGATAAVISRNSISYWKVSGLTGTGGMSVVTGLKDNMSRLAADTTSDHTITFGTNYGLTVGSGNTMILKLSDFDLTDLQLSDITLTDSTGVNRALAVEPGAGTWGAIINNTNKTINFDVPLSGDGGYDASSQIIIKIGTNATSGVNQIINPDTAGTYYETLTINNSVGESGEVAIPVVDSDQVNVTGFVNTFISFDIDTGTTDVDCAYNGCLAHSGGVSAANYVIDLGELNSTWVNKSESTSVMHSDGNNGTINSIYFDLTTNAYNGAVLYVKSANGGLQGPGTNLIPPVADGNNIQANDGTYGFQLTDTGSGNGTIVRNSNCTITTTYCGLGTSQKEVFNTDGRPLDNGRIRMDLAAASSYVNNPGSYTDTLTFVAIPTY